MIGNKLTPFKFWCQKILPTVYDDSMSYYEYLCKLNEYLNEVIEQINTLTQAEEDFQTDLSQQWEDYKSGLNDDWLEYKTGLTEEWNTYSRELTEAWLETKGYIDNYFDNLNVQTEINNKLDAMATDGTLTNLITPYMTTNLPTIVTTWLTEHVTPVGSAVVVDDSLTITGAAADAKTSGDYIDAVVANTNAVLDGNGYAIEYFNKTYNTGYQSDSGYYVTKAIQAVQNDYVLIKGLSNDDLTNKSKLLFFDINYAYIGSVQINSITPDGQGQRIYQLTDSNTPNVKWVRYQDLMSNIPNTLISTGIAIPYRKIVFDKKYAYNVTDITDLLNYLDRVELPVGSFTCGQTNELSNVELVGSGIGTVVTYTATYTHPMIRVKNGTKCIVKNLTIQREGSDVVPDHDTGYRCIDVRNMQNTLIENVTFLRFTGTAINCSYMYESSSKCNTLITNCDFAYNYRSIWLNTRAEFCIITDCHFWKNAFGVENDGGNNVVADCQFRENLIGMYMEAGESFPNDTHGSITGCVFAHNNYSIDFKNTTNGMVIANCNIFYGVLRLTYSVAALFNNCNIGDITIRDSGSNFNKIMNSIIQGTITYDGAHTNLVIENCTDKTGTPYVAP